MATRDITRGCSSELLYAKKIVAVRHTVVRIAARTVIDRSRMLNSDRESLDAVLVLSSSNRSMLSFLAPMDPVDNVKGEKTGAAVQTRKGGATTNFSISANFGPN